MLHASDAVRTRVVGRGSAELRALLSKNTKQSDGMSPAEATASAAKEGYHRAFASVI
jgi:hypothetical protein